MTAAARRPVRIANCSGFLGDRQSAAREMVMGGPIDVLTGDWLAELTMLILARQRARRPEAGFALPFVEQMREVLPACIDKGIRIISNAGGVNPDGCAEAVRQLAKELGVDARVAAVSGDDLMPRIDELTASGEELAHLVTGQPLSAASVDPISANAYLGAWGIAEALERGADIVITGRVTDAAVVTGAAAWWHGWGHDDWDALAGSVVAGHVIECGAQTTGGNFAFFDEVPRLEHPGFPVAEIAADGSSVITKHEGTGGRVSVDTVTAQLLYEIGGPRYPNPDVVARFDTISLAEVGPDRVAIGPVRGEPAPLTTKVCINYLGGYRNSVTFVLTGLDIEAKAALAERALWASVGGPDRFEAAHAELIKGEGDGHGLLQVTVIDADRQKVGRAFSNKATEMGLSSYPGFFMTAPPGDAREFGVMWPALVSSSAVHHRILFEGEEVIVASPAPTPDAPVIDEPRMLSGSSVAQDWGATVPCPLGRVAGARSGDKGGDANVGVWVRDDVTFDWLAAFLTADRVRELVSETAPFAIDRYEFPRLCALNFVVKGLLGRGVAASTRFDTQAKSLGERVRFAVVDIPEKFLTMRNDRR